tara:strand:+ start:230 stop:559 length:330 start_codon:yes stop_codon:yes gene_type:complete
MTKQFDFDAWNADNIAYKDKEFVKRTREGLKDTEEFVDIWYVFENNSFYGVTQEKPTIYNRVTHIVSAEEHFREAKKITDLAEIKRYSLVLENKLKKDKQGENNESTNS